MTNVFHRHTRLDPARAVGGDGIYIIDAEGKRYLDASGGAAVSCLGHSDEDVRKAIKDQVDEIAFAHTGFFTTAAAEELAGFLAGDAPPGIEWVYFSSGGSEAMETALKMSRQYFIETGQPQRTRFIARAQSYHGNTLGALAVSGNAHRREPYRPLLMDVTHIAPCHAYRYRKDGETEEAYGLRAADELEAALLKLGPETVVAFIAETVVGATLGAAPAAPGYFKRIREICDRYGVLLILDEVMCGMGRTGTLHACEHDGVVPDIMTVAKGLGAGYQPIGATLVSSRVFEAFRRGSGAFEHGHTYNGHPTACACALAVQKAIKGRNLLANVNVQGDALAQSLARRFAGNPFVGDIRGRGLFRGVELVADKESKAPFDPALGLHARIKKEAMVRGLICYPNGGGADGVRGDHVLLAPPFIIERDQIEELVDKLAAAIDAALKGIGV